MLTMIAAKAIIPGVTSVRPCFNANGLRPDGFFDLSVIDVGPKRIVFNICADVSMLPNPLTKETPTYTNARFRNRPFLSRCPFRKRIGGRRGYFFPSVVVVTPNSS